MAAKSGQIASKISVVLDDGETVYPFKPPTEKEWRKIVKKVRKDHPLPFPVRITRSEVAPDNTSCDFGYVEVWYTDGRPSKAHIWVNSLQCRASAIDSLLHEWAHLQCELFAPHPKGDSNLPHDDLFWVTFGKLYRNWLNEKP